MSAIASDGQVSLSWDNPFDDIDWYKTLIVRKVGSYPVTQSDCLIVYNGTGSVYVDTNVVNGITYYYVAFTYDNVPNFSAITDGAKDNATPAP